MKKMLKNYVFISSLFVIGGLAHANTTLNPIENLKQIKENTRKERARYDAYKKATEPKKHTESKIKKTKQ